MDASLNDLLAATAAFVVGHFAISSTPLRGLLVARLGERAYAGLFSVLMIVFLFWAIRAYGAATYVELWPPMDWTRWVPIVVMPFAAILVVAGLTTPNVTSVMQEQVAERPDPAPGIIRVTRHPFLWGALLWALSHIPPNGDVASVILMGGMAVLAGVGMRAIDIKREASLGAAWGPIAMRTSALPFAAIAQGRNSFDLAGIGWWRIVAGLALYVLLLHPLHGLLFGIEPLGM